MSIDVDTITGPAFLASALVNGDKSGLNEKDLQVLQNFLQNHVPEGWSVVSTVDDQEPRFTWYYPLYGGDAQGGDVIDYVIHRSR